MHRHHCGASHVLTLPCLSVHRDFAAQVAIEMPFDIKAIESPTHKIKMKVCRMGVTSSIRDVADVQFIYCMCFAVCLLFVCTSVLPPKPWLNCQRDQC